MQIGWCGTPYKLAGQERKAVGLANGVDFTLRYSYFFGRYAGAFFSLSGGVSGANARNYFKTANRADGDKYIYNPEYADSFSSTSYLPIFLAGPAFRFDWMAWSLRPRLGIGVGRAVYDSDFYTFSTRADKMLAGGTLREISSGGGEYLSEEDSRYALSDHVTSFALGASLQLAYTMRQHCYIYVEAGVTSLLSGVCRSTSYYSAKSAYAPENWAQAVYDSDKIGQAVIDDSHAAVNREDGIAGLNLTASFGIGWNIGWNRNENGWYRGRR